MKTKMLHSKLTAFLFTLVFLLGISTVAYAASSTQLSLVISNGTLSVDIVDAAGVTVAFPAVGMSAITAGFSAQTSTGTLGVSAQKIRLANPTSTPTWTVSLAATSGVGAEWDAAGLKMDFNAVASSTGTLTVDPSGGTIVAIINGITTGVSLGSSATFDQGITDSITLYSADGTAATFEQYDLTGVSLSQEVPGGQNSGSYGLNMTITVI